jgi:outer membrane protein TolC
MGHFGGRTDFDVRCYWTLSNLGIGNLALIKERKAEVGQAVGERVRMINTIRQEVASAFAQGLALKNQLPLAMRELETAERGFEADRLRARDNIGRPIEVLNSLNLLAAARVNMIRAVNQYNQAQFRLFVALGSPPPLGPLMPATTAPRPAGRVENGARGITARHNDSGHAGAVH